MTAFGAWAADLIQFLNDCFQYKPVIPTIKFARVLACYLLNDRSAAKAVIQVNCCGLDRQCQALLALVTIQASNVLLE